MPAVEYDTIGKESLAPSEFARSIEGAKYSVAAASEGRSSPTRTRPLKQTLHPKEIAL